jgi:hypothetical protein
MAIKWYYISKIGEIGSYEVSGNLTDLSRGIVLAYGEYLTAGLNSEEEAVAWAKEWSACLKCKTTVKGKHGETCKFCGKTLVNKLRPDFVSDTHLEYLDNLRESGETNMFGAAEFVMAEFNNLTRGQAREVLLYWIRTFSDRHPKME